MSHDHKITIIVNIITEMKLSCLGFLLVSIAESFRQCIQSSRHLKPIFSSNCIITTDQIPSKNGAIITSFGNPKIIPPGRTNNQWLLWHHVRDDKFSNDIVKLSSGKVVFATSNDGLTDWQYHPDNPALSPSLENGDWFLFDAEHVGVGDVIEPGMYMYIDRIEMRILKMQMFQ